MTRKTSMAFVLALCAALAMTSAVAAKDPPHGNSGAHAAVVNGATLTATGSGKIVVETTETSETTTESSEATTTSTETSTTCTVTTTETSSTTVTSTVSETSTTTESTGSDESSDESSEESESSEADKSDSCDHESDDQNSFVLTPETMRELFAFPVALIH